MKKSIPLQVLKTLEPFLEKKGRNFEQDNSKGYYLRFKDRDKDSNFHFTILEFKTDSELRFHIEFCPINIHAISNFKDWVKGTQLEIYFNNWVKLLDGYEKVRSIYDDPIVEAYAEEYYEEFEILDVEASIKPLTTKQVLLLDKHLENIQNKISKYQTLTNQEDILEIKSDIKELRENLTNKPKDWVIREVSKIWAKMTKQGTGLLKDFLSESKKQALQAGVKFLLEKGGDLIN